LSLAQFHPSPCRARTGRKNSGRSAKRLACRARVLLAKGNIIQNPFLSVANKCLLQMAQIESEFGMTPSSRARVRAAAAPDSADPFEEYLKRGKDA